MATATVQPGPVVGRTRAGCKLVATVGGGRLTPSDGSVFPARQRGPAGTGSVDGPMMDMLGPPGASPTSCSCAALLRSADALAQR